MTTFGRNLLLSVLLLCAAAYFLHAGDQGIAASLVLAVVTLWSRSGRVKEGVLGLVLAGSLSALGAGVLHSVVWTVQSPPRRAAVAAGPEVVGCSGLGVFGVDRWLAVTVIPGTPHHSSGSGIFGTGEWSQGRGWAVAALGHSERPPRVGDADMHDLNPVRGTRQIANPRVLMARPSGAKHLRGVA